jgi:hypothetical protein
MQPAPSKERYMEAVPTQSRSSRLRKTRLRKTRLRMTGLALAAVAVIGLSLAACSSGSSVDPSAASGNSSAAASNGEAEFAQCVRQHGVSDMPDPQNGHFLLPGDVESNPNWPSAVQACQHFMPGGQLGGNSGNSSALLAYSHCMQTHGVPQYPDPASNGAIDMPKSIDPNSPTVQKAEQECKSYLPGGQG